MDKNKSNNTRRKNNNNNNKKSTRSNRNSLRKNNNNISSNNNNNLSFYKYNENDIILFIPGLGCHLELSRKNRNSQEKLNIPYYILDDTSKEITKRIGINAEAICSKKVSGTVKNIVKTVCHIRPSKDDAFVKVVFSRIKELLGEEKRVILVGHSYGGSVVSRVAEIVNSEKDMSLYKKLFCMTLGSIYIPKKEKLDKIHKNVFHVMFYGDVAVKCNKLNTPSIDDEEEIDAPYIRWYIGSMGETAVKQRSIFGTRLQWITHNQYNLSFLDELLRDPGSNIVKRLRETDIASR
jgi:hypothetical protein